jgi:hypothetical protein
LNCATFTEEFAIRGTHSTFTIAGVSCSIESFVVSESSVFKNICFEKRTYHNSLQCCAQGYHRIPKIYTLSKILK